MKFRGLVRSNLVFHRAAHLAAFAGIAIAAAALAGALIVGDSIRETLRAKALSRAAGASRSISAGDRFFTTGLRSIEPGAVPILVLPGTCQHESGKARANNVQVVGIGKEYFKLTGAPAHSLSANETLLSHALQQQLGAEIGDELVLRIAKPGQFANEAALAPGREASIGWRVRVAGVLTPDSGGDLNLQGSGTEALNLFVSIENLGEQTGLAAKANVILLPEGIPGGGKTAADLDNAIARHWTLEDAGLIVRDAPGGTVEIVSPRIFIESFVIEAASRLSTNVTPILGYLANLIEHGTNATPYSIIVAAGAPYTSPEMRDDEIMLSTWLAEDLKAAVGDMVRMSWFVPESGARLAESTNLFRVAGIFPMQPPYADRTLMPEFPGIQEAERTHDWDAGFPLVYTIRDKDEEYWREHRGAPKAIITLPAGRKMWANRFGEVTAIRVQTGQTAAEFGRSLLEKLRPSQAGYAVRDVRSEALRAAGNSQDFGQLFLAFSFFIIFSALMLLGLLFRFALEARSEETGTLAAAGFGPRRLRQLYTREAMAIAIAGAVLGAVLGTLYARVLLWALSAPWSASVGGLLIAPHVKPATLAASAAATVLLSIAVVWFVVRERSRQAPRELLSGEIESWQKSSRWTGIFASVCLCGAAVLLVVNLRKAEANPAGFFGAGWFLLAAGWAFFHLRLQRKGLRRKIASRAGLVFAACVRRPRRSSAVVGMLSAGCFVIVAVSAFRIGESDLPNRPSSGAGGFELIGSSSLPILQDLGSADGRRALGLEELAPNVSIVPFRVREGDEASCLNLNRAVKPRLLGVEPALLKGRFAFSQVASGLDPARGWELLRVQAGKPSDAVREIPAIGDANSIRWSMGKTVGDHFELVDESGSVFRLRIVAAIQNSILQGSLLIDEQAFLRAFPRTPGHRLFLVDASSDPAALTQLSGQLSSALEDYGFEVAPAARRLASLNAVQNTYITTFQVLGGIGLLLGISGLGVLVLRNVLERRAELALMLAAGFRKRQLTRIIIAEHTLLLTAGLLVGSVAAVVAIVPAISQRQIAWTALLLALALVLLNGLLWTWGAARVSLRGELMDTLRKE